MILRNAIRCLHCRDVVESTHLHDYAACRCGKVAADGGRQYLRRAGNPEDFEELSTFAPDPAK